MSTSIISNETSSISPFKPPESREVAGDLAKNASHLNIDQPKSLVVPTNTQIKSMRSSIENLENKNPLSGNHTHNVPQNKDNNGVPKLMLDEDDSKSLEIAGGSKTQLLEGMFDIKHLIFTQFFIYITLLR